MNDNSTKQPSCLANSGSASARPLSAGLEGPSIIEKSVLASVNVGCGLDQCNDSPGCSEIL